MLGYRAWYEASLYGVVYLWAPAPRYSGLVTCLCPYGGLSMHALTCSMSPVTVSSNLVYLSSHLPRSEIPPDVLASGAVLAAVPLGWLADLVPELPTHVLVSGASTGPWSVAVWSLMQYLPGPYAAPSTTPCPLSLCIAR